MGDRGGDLVENNVIKMSTPRAKSFIGNIDRQRCPRSQQRLPSHATHSSKGIAKHFPVLNQNPQTKNAVNVT